MFATANLVGRGARTSLRVLQDRQAAIHGTGSWSAAAVNPSIFATAKSRRSCSACRVGWSQLVVVPAMKGKDEAAALVAVLQNTGDSEARASACESVLLCADTHALGPARTGHAYPPSAQRSYLRHRAAGAYAVRVPASGVPCARASSSTSTTRTITTATAAATTAAEATAAFSLLLHLQHLQHLQHLLRRALQRRRHPRRGERGQRDGRELRLPQVCGARTLQPVPLRPEACLRRRAAAGRHRRVARGVARALQQVKVTAHRPDLLGPTVQAPGCATHSALGMRRPAAQGPVAGCSVH
eukprot:scaffold96129_cov60-Phaeocystis_antarctica.AAC.1